MMTRVTTALIGPYTSSGRQATIQGNAMVSWQGE